MPRIRLTKAQQAKIRQHRKRRGMQALKRFRKPRISRPLALATHNFVENIGYQDLDVKTPLQAGNVFSYYVAQIGEWTQYRAIFKLYRINKVVVTFKKDIADPNVYNNNLSSANQAYALQNVELSYLREYTDNAAPANMTAFKANSKVRQVILTNSNPSHTVTLTPAVQKLTTYEDELIGNVTKTQPVFKPWLDTSFDELNHRGLQVMLTGQALTSPGKVRMDTKIYFSCRNQD